MTAPISTVSISVEIVFDTRIMKTSVFSVDGSGLGSLQLVMWCLCVICATVIVSVASVNPVEFDEGLGGNRKPSGRNVEMQGSVEFQQGSPYWANPRLLQEAEESITEGAVLFSTDECSR